MRVFHIVPLGLENALTVELENEGQGLPLDQVARMELHMSSLDGRRQVLVDSNEQPTVFEWAGDLPDGRVRLRIGRATGLMRGRYSASLVTYDATHPNGYMWLDEILLRLV